MPDSKARAQINALRTWLDTRIIGQQHLRDRLLMALLVGGHVLVEGAPGLAKTRAIKELARAIDGEFHRIQFTPDLLPSDVTGTEIYQADSGTFRFQHGPIFHNLVLADEINRAPAKVQSALLEAMAEHQVTYGRRSFRLPDLFMVMATQNPIEQEGTYSLPEAQLDRFLLHVRVDYPQADAERKILELVRKEAMQAQQNVSNEAATTLGEGDQQPPIRLSANDVFTARREILSLHMATSVEEYVVQLVIATRPASANDVSPFHDSVRRWLDYGASPRATIAIDQCARVEAWLAGRDFVTPEDVQQVAPDVLRHRLIRSYAAEAEDVSVDVIVQQLLAAVPAP